MQYIFLQWNLFIPPDHRIGQSWTYIDELRTHNVNAGDMFCCRGMFRLVKGRQIKIDNAHCLPCANF